MKKVLFAILISIIFTSCIQQKKLCCLTNTKYWWRK